ncbi:hypothetical protein H0H93_002962 [Arthromyces matolae]|nr:hypothetical protein H0H93_002962 [Arthromyces matolae]
MIESRSSDVPGAGSLRYHIIEREVSVGSGKRVRLHLHVSSSSKSKGLSVAWGHINKRMKYSRKLKEFLSKAIRLTSEFRGSAMADISSMFTDNETPKTARETARLIGNQRAIPPASRASSGAQFDDIHGHIITFKEPKRIIGCDTARVVPGKQRALLRPQSNILDWNFKAKVSSDAIFPRNASTLPRLLEIT